MSFLPLPAATRRLRQVAKAHAAGEIAREEYRRMRRDIIDELHVEFSATGSVADTFSLKPDSTQRRGERAAVEERLVLRELEPTRELRRNILTAVAAFVCILALFLGISAFAAPATVIPPLKDRDPNPKNSMVLSVSGVRVTALTEAPKISQAELDEQIALWFADAKTSALAVGNNGFSTSELDEVGSLLNRLGIHNQNGLDATALEALNALVARQKNRRMVSLQQIERIAEKLQDYFRNDGYLAARAYVPAQTIVDDRVALHVLPGRLEAVVTESTSGLATMAARAFEAQLGQAAQARSLEQVLYKLNSLSGVKATGSLQAGNEVGGTQLDLRLVNPSRVVGELSIDNHGDERSAKYRLRGSLDWQNPLGRGDSLRFDLAQRFESQEAHGLTLKYRTPTFLLGDVASASYSFGDFGVSSRGGDIDGQHSTFRFGLERQMYGQRDRSLNMGASASYQRLELDALEQKLWFIEPAVSMHQVFDAARWVVRGRGAIVAGKLGEARYTGQSASFVKVSANFSAWRPIANQELRLHFSGQLGTNDLPDSLKQPLGGYGQITGVRPSSYLADSAFVLGVEMSTTPDRWRPFGSLALYSRLGSGQREIGDNAVSAFAWEGGIVWRLATRSALTSEVRLGVPLSVDGFDESGGRDARLLLSLGWRP